MQIIKSRWVVNLFLDFDFMNLKVLNVWSSFTNPMTWTIVTFANLTYFKMWWLIIWLVINLSKIESKD
jgi:hypothetical protein